MVGIVSFLQDFALEGSDTFVQFRNWGVCKRELTFWILNTIDANIIKHGSDFYEYSFLLGWWTNWQRNRNICFYKNYCFWKAIKSWSCISCGRGNGCMPTMKPGHDKFIIIISCMLLCIEYPSSSKSFFVFLQAVLLNHCEKSSKRVIINKFFK